MFVIFFLGNKKIQRIREKTCKWISQKGSSQERGQKQKTREIAIRNASKQDRQEKEGNLICLFKLWSIKLWNYFIFRFRILSGTRGYIHFIFQKEEKEARRTGISTRRPFDRDIDLQVNRFDQAQKKTILMKAQLLDDRFSRGQI